MVLRFVLLNSECERKAMGKRMFFWEFPTASHVGWEVQPPPTCSSQLAAQFSSALYQL